MGEPKSTGIWRPEPESNRRARFCKPLRHHSAIGPRTRVAERPPNGSARLAARSGIGNAILVGSLRGLASANPFGNTGIMSVNDLIMPIDAAGGTIVLPDASRWMQGRTLYGGASALIAYTAAIRALPDLPPLRAAQIAFVAPIGDRFDLHTEIVRQGRNVIQVRSAILIDDEVALTAFWLFGNAREPNAVHSAPPPVPEPGIPDDCKPADISQAPEFLRNNYDIRYTAARDAADKPIIRRWARLREPAGIDPISELILTGDTLPPSAAKIMRRRGPISSINWSFNLLDPEPQTRNGWWLAETASDHADQGYSSERLRIWNADGKQMLSGIQAVAIFG